jgi:hypothetical protein
MTSEKIGTAIDADTKVIVSWFIGGRDGDCAKWFIVESEFGANIDCAMLVKL